MEGKIKGSAHVDFSDFSLSLITRTEEKIKSFTLVLNLYEKSKLDRA